MSDSELLSALQSHGQRFLESFSLPELKTKKRKRFSGNIAAGVGDSLDRPTSTDPEFEEWNGCSVVGRPSLPLNETADSAFYAPLLWYLQVPIITQVSTTIPPLTRTLTKT
jgi:hypothetical protein